MKRIYLDYASLTPVDNRVKKAINKYYTEEYTNPSALYYSAINSKNAIDNAKRNIADILHIHSDEMIFTSGGTESNQLVLNSFLGKKILISSIEHSSIINNQIDNKNILQIPIDKDGIVDLDQLKKMLNPEIDLISIMMVNNEIGTIQPIREISKMIRDAGAKFNKRIIFHTDASQAPLHQVLHLEKLNIDLMTLDSNKIYGPRGIGMLYIKRNTLNINRPGTLNIPGIIGFSLALEIAEKMKEKETKRIFELKNYFFNELIKINSNIKMNGTIENTVPNILNISIPNIDNEFFVLKTRLFHTKNYILRKPIFCSLNC